MVLDSLPDRPLRRAEIDSLDSSDSIHGSYPVYSERDRDTAYGLVLILQGTAYALAYTDGDGWETVETRNVDADEHGLSVDEMDTLKELQDAAAKDAGAQIGSERS